MIKSEKNNFDGERPGKGETEPNTKAAVNAEGAAADPRSAAASAADQAAIDELLEAVMNGEAGEDGAAEATEAEAEVELSPLEKAQAEAEQYRDRFARLQAEWDNFRKRTATERDNERRRAAASLVERLLPIIDDMERAIEHSDNASAASLKEGTQAVLNKLNDVLQKEGLATIDPLGEAFDANIHQAVGKVDDTSMHDETVAQVYQKGYRMGDKVLRNAMVVVSQGGPKREAAPEAKNENDQ